MKRLLIPALLALAAIHGPALAAEPRSAPANSPVSIESALHADSLEQRDEAIRQYRSILKGTTDPALASMVRSRIFTLSREVYDERARAAVGQESKLANAVGPNNTVAVGRFENLSDDETSAPLEKGIPAMLSSDMAQVKKLTVLERVELEALLRELSLSRSAMFDSSTAPRLGHLMSAGRVVVGSFRHEKTDKLEMHAQVVNVKSGRLENSVKVNGKMRDFFVLEKDLVFKLVDKLGVRLTTAERSSIERQVPTKDLAAFLAYGRGLDEEDRGNFKGASEQYQQAASKDPGFTEAKAAAAATGRGTISYGDMAKGFRAGQAAPPTVKPVAVKPAPSGPGTGAGTGEGANDIVMERAFETERLTGSGLIPDLGSGEAHDRQVTRPAVSSNGTVIVTGSLPR